MEWNVYVGDFNANEIKVYNIFNHSSFTEDVKKICKKYKDDYATFCDKLKGSLMYYFWSKCEWEIILSDWPPSDRFNSSKVSVYDQIMLNKEAFMKYVWDTAHTRKTRAKKNSNNQKT